METPAYCVPKELLIKLFSHFSPLELAKAALIDKQLNTIANENRLWRKFLYDPLPIQFVHMKARDIYNNHPECIRPEYRHYEQQAWFYSIEKQLASLKKNPNLTTRAKVFEALIPLLLTHRLSIEQALLVEPFQLGNFFDPEIRDSFESGKLSFEQVLAIKKGKIKVQIINW